MGKPRTQPSPTSAKVFDLASRYAADTVEVAIVDPADLAAKLDTGARITIRSLYSKEARDAALAARNTLKLVDGTVDATDADFEQHLFEQTVAVTVGWSGFVVDGETIPCTPATVRALYSDPRTAWVQKQVQAAYLDIGRFFGTRKAS